MRSCTAFRCALGLTLASLAGCATDPSAPVDAAVDAPAATFTAMTAVTTLSQNCMPAVAADPLSLGGTVTLTNTGPVPIGPITLSAGSVTLLLGGSTLATFAVAPVTLPVVAPGRSGTVAFTKTAGSLAGDGGVTGCAITPCDTPVRVMLRLAGPGLADGARAASEPLTIACTH